MKGSALSTPSKELFFRIQTGSTSEKEKTHFTNILQNKITFCLRKKVQLEVKITGGILYKFPPDNLSAILLAKAQLEVRKGNRHVRQGFQVLRD